MSKRAKVTDEPDVDPTVRAVQQSYEETLTFFMSNISTLMNKYNESLNAVKNLNTRVVAADPPSPLLVRHQLDEAGANEVKKQSEAALRRHSSAMSKPAMAAAAAAADDEEWEDVEDDEKNGKKKHKKRGSKKTKKRQEEEEAAAAEAQQADEATNALLEAVAISAVLLVQMKLIKQEARSLGKVLDQVHDWVALNVPTMKEEDNAGVAVLAQVIEEISGFIGSVREIYDLEAEYVSSRTELELKVLKSSDAVSSKPALEVCDSDAWDSIEKGWRTLMRVVLLAHATLAKNMKVLRDPRSAPRSQLSL
jgi:hypothetical protein